MIDTIRGENLLKQYDGKTVLSCSIEINDKSIFSIIGPNGSGKSTLLRLLCLLEKPDEGKVIISNQEETLINPFKNLPLRRKIVLVHAQPRLFRGTVFNNLTYGLKLRGEKKEVIKTKVDAVLKVVGLEHKTRATAANLSSGEKQRTAIARALVLEPDALFLDEPTASLDPENVKLIEKQIVDWNQKTGKTMVIVTHNLFQAKTLSDYIIFMYNGEIIEFSKTKDFFQNPQTELGRRFISGEIY